MTILTLKDGIGNTRPNQENKNAKYSLTAGLDYFRCILTFTSEKSLKEAIKELTHGNPYQIKTNTPWSPGSGTKFYPHSVHTPCGIRGGYQEKDTPSGKLWELMLDYSGLYLQRLNIVDYTQLCYQVKHLYHGRCSRIDVNLDDWNENVIPVNKMVKAYDRGDIGLFRSYKLVRSDSWKKGEQQSESTHYFGSRNSGKMVRIYRHWHSGLDCYSLRYEAEFKRGRGDELFNFLADFDWRANCKIHQSTEDAEILIAQALAGYALGVLDFVNKSEKEGDRVNLKDCERLRFWQTFVNRVGAHIRTSGKKKVVSLSRRLEWLYRQVAKSFKLIYEGMGEGVSDFVQNLIDVAGDRWSKEDELMLEQLKREIDKGYSYSC